MRVLAAMSGGVDSSVAAARLLDEGHEVVGVTLKLWGGESDSGCCSVSDVDDARRVADHLGIEHHVFAFADDFTRHVVDPYVADHAAGRTPNPCIECNRHVKFDRLLRRAVALGFDAVATGHHARIATRPDGTRRVGRGIDPAKDQSYVLHMLDQDAMARTLLPIGHLTKAEVRAEAARRGLRTAAKPDSQDVCFITRGGREAFLGRRIPLRPARVVDGEGRPVGTVDAIELVTVGQRRGLHLAGAGAPRYAVEVDVEAGVVVVGDEDDLRVDEVDLDGVTWAAGPVAGALLAQGSAHGEAVPVVAQPGAAPTTSHPWPASGALVGTGTARLRFAEPRRRIAPGQSVVLYDGDDVVGGGTAR
ncbi:MAG: tRNA 2-thiouridine(34) synthase MnmA [Acidimicrobiales bacterium]